MSKNGNSGASGGIGLMGVLGVVFVVLKLVGVINWSWWLVLLPFYGGLALILSIVLVLFLIGLLSTVTWKRKKKK